MDNFAQDMGKYRNEHDGKHKTLLLPFGIQSNGD